MAIKDLINIFDEEKKTYLNTVIKIAWIKDMIMIIIVLIAYVAIFSNFMKQLKEEIFLTRSMMKMIPADLLQDKNKLFHKFITGN